MGLFNWLTRGTQDVQEPIVIELAEDVSHGGMDVRIVKEHVERLRSLDPGNKGFPPGEAENGAKAIGEELYAKYGVDGMAAVCDALGASGGRKRTLELIWDGIGEWQG